MHLNLKIIYIIEGYRYGEKRLKVNFNKGGKGGVSAKLTLPIKMIRELGLSEEEKYIDVYFSDNKIIIEKSEEQE